MNNSQLADKFDNFRKIRNNINYYGKDLPGEEAKIILAEMKDLIQKIKEKLF